MKVMFLTNAYPPEIGGTANLFFELAQALKGRGHSISVVTCVPRDIPIEINPHAQQSGIEKENRKEAEVIRVKIPRLNHRIPFMKEFEHFINVWLYIIACLKCKTSDVILITSPPLVIAYAALICGFFKKAKVILNVQDIFPQNFIDLGVMKNKPLIALSRFLEKDIYKRVDWLTVMSQGNKKIIDETSQQPGKVSVVENWIDADYIVPGEKMNEFRSEFGLGDKFVLSFAGCMADSQDMKIILDSAKLLEKEKDIIFLLAGNGPKYDVVVKMVSDSGLNNVKLIPIQPREKYVQLLAASDVGMVTLNPLVKTPTVPSKIKSIMSASRPVLASFPEGGDAPRLIRDADCGVVVAAGDTLAFTDAILKLYWNTELCKTLGQNGRKYVLEHLTVQKGAEAYANIFNRVYKDGVGC
ncbi:MAG: glycosyltransferase family 4 protein [Candidatus Margulisbacteria bacterium]|nr:glycosyltransferase family 4 protein [Candidatus Margulisiibacteriota bacterium]MBU1022123.1 glycosyltransferase family 4 protein [Candidatus Margulisiibacteriota bacterium]MBU1728639.1 glycosyltransferase family 4 protein [Candidatus Margulisiibacteriota bacterium]MBU1955090.1 glycosyltransferase family 4 protein [Candidatus Margulisiibacteriota bacterium]